MGSSVDCCEGKLIGKKAFTILIKVHHYYELTSLLTQK